jgi:hypothetical protein
MVTAPGDRTCALAGLALSDRRIVRARRFGPKVDVGVSGDTINFAKFFFGEN